MSKRTLAAYLRSARRLIWLVHYALKRPPMLLPARAFLKRQYMRETGARLDLKNPVSYAAKVQWLKLYDRQPEYPSLVDKYDVRKYVAEAVSDEYLIPCYGVWDDFDEIPFDALPDQFVLKCTHDSHSVVICQDKKQLDMQAVRKHFKEYLARNYYYRGKEWVYKNIRPRIIAEKLLVDANGGTLKDYKIYCFNGKPKVINVIFDRFESRKENFYSLEWELLNIRHGDCQNETEQKLEKPKELEKMLDLARTLSAGKIHVRVDLYVVDDKIYFGEITFYSRGGYKFFNPPEWDNIFGGWMELPKAGRP